jgi:hypothetical protein
LLFLPLVCHTLQYGGVQPFNCDFGEEAFAQWYVSRGGPFYATWVLFDTRLWNTVPQQRLYTPWEDGFLTAWIVPRPTAFLLHVRWQFAYESWWVTGSCVI